MADCFCCCIADFTVQRSFDTAKWFYFGLFTLSSIITWVLRDYADDVVDWVPGLDACDTNDEGRSACFGKGAVLRMSFALCIFHLLHALLLIRCTHAEDPRRHLHTDCMSLQFLVWIGSIIVAFLLSDDFYQAYGEVARVFSGLFLVFQAVVIIDTVYTINEAMIDREECMYPLIGGALVTFALSFAFMITGYALYAPRATCSTTVFWNTFTLILSIVVTLISISKWRIERAGLFTSGIVVLYAAFLLLSALISLPDDYSCVESGGISSGWMQVVSFLIALVVVLASTLRVGTAEISASEGDLPYRPDYFHLILTLAGFYIAMLFTNWNLEDVAGDFDFDEGRRSAWIKIGSQWFVFALYTWTMLAHKILSDRDFS